MAEEKLWDYDFPVNANQVTISFDTGESSLSQLLGSSSDFEGHLPLHNQPLPDYNFTSFIEEFEREYGLAPNPSMVNDHGLFSEENAMMSHSPAMADGAAIEELPPNSSTGMMGYIPTSVDQDVTMAESAPFSSMVHQIASLPDEEFLEFVMKSSMVSDHADSSNEGNNVTMEETKTMLDSSNEGNNVSMEETVQTPDIHSSNELNNMTVEETTQTPVTPCENVNSPRLTVTFDNHPIPRVCWTPELHARFVLAVEHLGGCKCRCQTEAYFITDECKGFKSDSRGEPFTVVPQWPKLIAGQY